MRHDGTEGASLRSGATLPPRPAKADEQRGALRVERDVVPNPRQGGEAQARERSLPRHGGGGEDGEFRKGGWSGPKEEVCV